MLRLMLGAGFTLLVAQGGRNQIDSVEVPATCARTHDAGGNRDGQVRFSRAGAADQHDIAPIFLTKNGPAGMIRHAASGPSPR